MNTLCRLIGAGAIALVVAPATLALTLNASQVGVYDDSGGHSNMLTTGWDFSFFGTSHEGRHYTVFDLTGVTDTITAATLEFTEPSGGYVSSDGSEVLEIFDVSTAIAALTGGTGGRVHLRISAGAIPMVPRASLARFMMGRRFPLPSMPLRWLT